MDVYCLMPLVSELRYLVHLSGGTFTHHGLNISPLPNSNKPTKQKLVLQPLSNLIFMSLNGIEKH